MRLIIRLIFQLITWFSAGLMLTLGWVYYWPITWLPVLDGFGNFAHVLWVFNVLLLVGWILARSRMALVPLAAVFISLITFENYYRPGVNLSQAHETTGIKVMSYNTHSFELFKWGRDEFKANNMLDFIREESPDILCMQEFSYEARRFLVDKLPYNYISPQNEGKTIQAIFSKYPILSGEVLDFPNTRNSAIFADILMGKDTVRVYNIHLQSYRIEGYRFLIRDNGFWFMNRLAETSKMHREQVRLLKAHQAKSPYPVMIFGDLNVPPYSTTYRKMKEGLIDTYAERGKGLGTTFSLAGIPYRIDCILVDPAFSVINHQNFDVPFSDHYPITAVLKPNAH
ncbi:MAG: hypothetical protein RLZZ241_1219 [Bacteroidota bacterium]|jgi:endonuclease/exonuclease/phosphatase family metal-dependent hydrolase